jgi:hypothetical protein
VNHVSLVTISPGQWSLSESDAEPNVKSPREVSKIESSKGMTETVGVWLSLYRWSRARVEKPVVTEDKLFRRASAGFLVGPLKDGRRFDEDTERWRDCADGNGPGTNAVRSEGRERTTGCRAANSFNRSAYLSVFNVCSHGTEDGDTVAITTVEERGFTKLSRRICVTSSVRFCF